MPQNRPLGPLAAYVLDDEERRRRLREQRAGQSLTSARAIPAPQAALAEQAAQVLGRAPIEVRQNAQLLEEARVTQEMQRLSEHHRSLRWLSDPDNAAVAHDQVDGLMDLERSMARPWADNPDPALEALRDRTPGARLTRHFEDWTGGVLRRAPGEAIEALGRSVEGLNTAGLRVLDRLGLADTPIGDLFRAEQRVGTRIRLGGQNVAGTLSAEDAARGRAAGARVLPQQEVDTGFVGDVSGGLGQMAGQVTVALGTGGYGVLPSLFGQGVSQMDDRVREDQERDGRTEYSLADDLALLGGGVVTGLSEKLGLDAILGRLPSPIQDRLKSRLAQVFVAGLTEGGTEITEAVGHNALAITALGEDTGLLDGSIEGGSVGAVVGSLARALLMSAIPGRQHVGDEIRATAAEAETARFDNLVDMVAGNPLLTQSPERLRSFLREASGEETVYVPAEAVATFFQSNPDMAGLIDDWGIREQYEEALVGGADIAIDAATYLTKVAQTPAHEAWRADLRHGLEAMSLKEAEAWKSGGEEALGKALDESLTEAESLTEEAAPAQQVYQEVFSQLREAGYTVDVARTNATVVAELFRVEAARNPNRYDSALAAYRDANLSIRAEFPQSLREADPARTDALIEALRTRRATPAARMAAAAAQEPAEGEVEAPAVDETAPEDAAALSDLERVLGDLGVDPVTATNEQVREALERVASAPDGSPVARYEQGMAAARGVAQTYKALAGIEKPDFVGPVQPVVEDMVQIADALEAAEHVPVDLSAGRVKQALANRDQKAVAKAYKALIDETVAQFLMMGDIKVEAWRGEGEPYANSRAMLADVQQNGHLWFFLTDAGFGEGADTSGHPLLAKTGLTLDDGTELLANDVFRIVHDYFGHAQQGFNFGPVGELNAYLEHETMYSEDAVPALAAETLMQNAWVNFGPHLRRPSLDILAESEDAADILEGDEFDLSWSREEIALDQIDRSNDFTDEDRVQTANDAPVLLKAAPGGRYQLLDGGHRMTRAKRGGGTTITAFVGRPPLPVRGDPDYVPIPERRFADQKAFIATPEVLALAQKAKSKASGTKTLAQADGADRASLSRPPVNADGTITLTHYGLDPDLTETDPTQWGRNVSILSRDERNRISSHLPRTYFGIGVGEPGGYSRERGVGEHAYVVDIDASRLYNAAADPDGFRQNLDGVPAYDRINQIERQIAAKYDGYWLKNGLGLTATVFKPMAVQPQRERVMFQSASAVIERLGDNIPGLSGVLPYLTGDERARLKKASAQKLVDLVQSLPDAAEMASVAFAGRAKRGWYERSANTLMEIFGAEDAARFAALLAAMSPQTSVESNAYNALATWVNWNRAGRPTEQREIIEIMGRSVQGDKGVASVLSAWINNSVRALTAENPAEIELSGPKVNAFMANLVGVVDEVTTDAWMATYAAIDPSLVAGRRVSEDALGVIKGKGPGYTAMSAVTRRAAAILTQRTGEEWTPAEVQETVWSWAKTLYERRDSMDRTTEDILAMGGLTHADIAATPDFATLFTNGVYRNILEAGGYGQELDDLLARGSGDRGAGEAGDVTDAEGAGVAEDVFSGHLAAAARRLEGVRQERRGRPTDDNQLTLFQSDPTAPPFFSALLRAVEASQTKAAPAAQWKATLAKTPGVKREELEWSGINDWLDTAGDTDPNPVLDARPIGPVVDAKGNIGREQIAAFLRAGGVRVDEVVLGDPDPAYPRDEWEVVQSSDGTYAIYSGDGIMERGYPTEDAAWADLQPHIDSISRTPTQFSGWKLPGADETYRELLITLPSIDGPATHWDTDNVVAHARLTERTDADGRRVLFVEEVQSDWHQKGRDQGYQQEPDEAEIAAAIIERDRVEKELRAAQSAFASTVVDGLVATAHRYTTVAQEEVSRGIASDLPGTLGSQLSAKHLSRAAEITALLESGEVASASRIAGMTLSNNAYAVPQHGAIDEARRDLSPVSLQYQEAVQRLNNAISPSGIPDAPFRTSWPALVMKRMIRWAVDHGFERVAWTTGKQQSERYNLSQAVGGLQVRPTRNAVFVMGKGMDRREVIPGTYDVVIGDRRARETVRAQLKTTYDTDDALRMTVDQMAEVFGRDVANRVVEKSDPLADPWDWADLREDDLTVGGEGMRAFYDRNLVNITNDLVKRYGAKVRPVDMTPAKLKRWRELEQQLNALGSEIDAANQAMDVELAKGQNADFRRLDALNVEHSALRVRAHDLQRQQRGNLPEAGASSWGVQPGFDITPALRDAAMSGFPLFQRSPLKGPRGQIALGDTGAVITVFQARDLTTLLHEMGHLSLERLIRNAADPAASEQVKSDLRIVLDYLNIRDPADVGVPHHELWAQSLERYLMEGRSPSLELRGVMKTVKGWFLSVYRTLTNAQVNVPITDEVRGVFDRLLATDEEIEAARVQLDIEAGFTDAAEAGMTAEAFADYQRLVTKARGNAEDDLMRRVMSTIRRERTAEWNAEADAIRPDVAADIDEQPEIRALNWLRANKVSLNRADVERMIGAEAMARLPKAVPPIVSANGLHPDNVAELAGYGSASELLEGLAQLEAERLALRAVGDGRSVRAKRIEDEVTARLREQYGDPLNDGSIEAEAMASLHGDRQADVLGVELGVLGRRIGQTPPPIAALRAWAAEQIGSRTVREAKPGKYLRAERKAANAVQKALASKDRAEAFRQKQAQTINHLLYSEARKAEEFADRAVRRLTKLDKSKTIRSMDQDYLDQIHALLEDYELRPVSGKQVQRRKSLLEFVTEQEALGNEIVVPQALLDAALRKNYADLTVDELRALDDTIRSLAHLGRLKQTLLDNRDRRDYEAVIDEALAQTQDLKNRKGLEGRNRKPNALRQFDAALWKAETLFDWLDRDQINGVFNRILLRPAVDAANREDQLHEGVGRLIRQHYDAIPRDQKKRWREKITVPELLDEQTGQPSVFDRGDLIAMALNVGNASNLDKLARGENWTPEDVLKVLNRELSVEEWGMVQGIWDALETLWPAIAATERRLTGVEPERVVPMPVQTTAGELRGGYYPVVYDPDRRANAQAWKELEAVDLFNGVFRGAATSKGHTKERTTYAGPVLLSVEGVLFGHLNKVIKRIAFAEYVMSARKFIVDDRVRKIITSKVGPEYYDQLMPWLQAQVTDRGGNNRDLIGLERFAKRARLNFQMVAMGLRVTTGLAQVAGFAQSAALVGKGRLAAAITSYAASIRVGQNDLANFVFERSEEMRQRMSSRDRDIRDAMRELVGKGGWLSEVQRAAFVHIGVMDQFVSVPTWLAAYQEVLADGGDEVDAIAAGDKAVRRSQGSGREYALAAVQRPNSEFMKLFTLFYSYFSVQYNRQRDIARYATTGDPAKAVSMAFWVMIAAPVMGAVLTGDFPDEEDGEGWQGWLAWSSRKLFFNLFSGVPLARDWASFKEREISGEYASYSPTPIGRAVESLETLNTDISDALTGEEVSDRWLKHAIEAPGYIIGLPTGQIANSAQYVSDVFSGAQTPDNLGEFLYGLAKGPQQDQE